MAGFLNFYIGGQTFSPAFATDEHIKYIVQYMCLEKYWNSFGHKGKHDRLVSSTIWNVSGPQRKLKK